MPVPMSAEPITDARPLAVFLMGPTASGKTDLAVALAQRAGCSLISVDSAMVYRGLDIGTAKPDRSLLDAVPHRLIDICDPTESYSAAQFCSDALREMADITASGRTPLLVGGTLLYFRALQQGLAPMPAADPGLRAHLEAEAARSGWATLHGRLAAVDPEAAARIHPNDPQRIQRALEVYELTGRPISRLQREGGWVGALPYRTLKLVLTPRERVLLHERIEKRFLRMLDQGLEQEVRDLWDRGDLTPELPSMRSVGYRQMLKYLLGEYNYDEMIRRGIFATRQLAKRQMTWLRGENGCHWLQEGQDLADEAWRVLCRAEETVPETQAREHGKLIVS